MKPISLQLQKCITNPSKNARPISSCLSYVWCQFCMHVPWRQARIKTSNYCVVRALWAWQLSSIIVLPSSQGTSMTGNWLKDYIRSKIERIFCFQGGSKFMKRFQFRQDTSETRIVDKNINDTEGRPCFLNSCINHTFVLTYVDLNNRNSSRPRFSRAFPCFSCIGISVCESADFVAQRLEKPRSPSGDDHVAPSLRKSDREYPPQSRWCPC